MTHPGYHATSGPALSHDSKQALKPCRDAVTKSHLKKVFWPNLCVGTAFQILDILEYACGLERSPVLSLNQNPIFEMTFIIQKVSKFS